MLRNLTKTIICSLGAIFVAQSAMACDDEASYERPTYVVYQVQPERPRAIYSTTRDYYSCTVEYRQTTEYSRTTRCEQRSYLPERPMRSIRYAYIDP